MAASGSKFAVFASIAANLGIALLKFVASFFTGSSAMLSEGIHSVVDTTNGLLLLLGMKRGRIGPDAHHAFGRAKETYFWSFVVAIFLFALGGGVALYEGIIRLLHGHAAPEDSGAATNLIWNYGVLAGATIFEGISLWIAWKEFRKQHPKGFKSALVASKDTVNLAVIIENMAALAGLFIAFAGVTLSHLFDNPVYDAWASILIGVVMSYVAYFMASETRELLIGESVTQEDLERLDAILESYPEIEVFGNIRTMHLGPDTVVVAMEANFRDDLTVPEVEHLIAEIKERIRALDPKYKFIYIEANSIRNPDFN